MPTTTKILTTSYETTIPTTTEILTTSYETTIPTTTEILTTSYETTLPVTTLPVCSSEAPIWDGMKCVTCASFGEKPYWNAETEQCEACPGTQIWDADNHTCIDCPTNTVHSINNGPWECALGCGLEKPLYVLSGSRKGQCVACPSDKPYYNSKLFQCEACPTNRPFFDTQTRTCTECPLATPIWDSSAGRCLACNGYWNTTLKQCLDDCSSQNPYFYQSSSMTTKQCVSTCPFDKPAVQNNKCATCYDIHGTSAPYWNSQTQQCENCPKNTAWNNSKQKCMATNCAGVYSWLSSGLEITEFQMCSKYAGRDVYYHVGQRVNSAYIYGERKPSECRNHALRASGYVYAFQDGNYTFKTHAYSCSEHSSKVDVQITIDNKLVHNITTACTTGTVTLPLTAGLHKINYYMYTFKRATAYLELQTSGAFFCSD
ncbi:MAG: hypothetical protein J6V11_00625 [Alphaproteobacteria bacterium]|nr:hypothetical protein [Alphaproteobacteria bacterium]